MKRIISLFAAALIAFLPATSLAMARPTFTPDDYVTLGELREQTLAGWHQTYNAMNRNVVADVDIEWMPQADTCPIVQVEGIGEEQLSQNVLDAYRAVKGAYVYAFDCSLTVDYFVQPNTTTGKPGAYYGEYAYKQPPKVYKDGARPDETPENVQLSYDELLARIQADVSSLCGLTWDDFHISEVTVHGREYKAMKNAQGELVMGDALALWGAYFLQAQQLVRGIPIVGEAGEYPITPKGDLHYHYESPNSYKFVLSCVREVAVHTPDVPLLSFDAMKRVLEAQIEAGQLRCVDDMTFGYMAFYRGDRQSGDWLLMPVWRVLCSYTMDADREDVLPYTDADGASHIPMEYCDYFYNAQTGVLLPTDAVLCNGRTDNPIMAGDIVTWEDIGHTR